MKQAALTRAAKSAVRASSQRDGERGTAVLAPPRYGIDFVDRAQAAEPPVSFDPWEAVTVALAPAVGVSSPTDARELEADRMADAVMRTAEPQQRLPAPVVAPSPAPVAAPVLVQKPEPEPEPEPEAAPLQPGLGLTAGSDAPEQPRPPIDEASSTPTIPPEPPADEVVRKVSPEAKPQAPTANRTELQAVARSGGRPLPGAVLQFMESRFAERFSNVRVHTDGRATALARSLAARAFTWGSHIVFGPGRFAPHTDEGRWLIAHELGHVIQHRHGASPLLRRKAEAAKPEAATLEAAKLVSPRAPEQDPEFDALRSRVANRAASQARHGSGRDKASAGARAAAIKPAELRSQAQRSQVATMTNEAEHPPSFDEDAFVNELLQEVERVAPKKKEEVLEFEKSGKAEEFDGVKATVGSSVGRAQASVQAPLAAASKQAPIPAQADREVTPLRPEGRGPDPGSVRGDRAMPPPRTKAEMDLAPAAAEAKQPLTESPVTQQLVADLPDDPTLGEAGRSTAELDRETEAAPLRYREGETPVLTSARVGASADAGKLLAGMVAQRGTSFTQVAGDQRAVKSDNEQRREDAAKRIDAIFTATKTKLDGRLAKLDTDVNQAFDIQAARATKKFREFIEKEAEKYQKSWLDTAYETVVEVFVGPLPKPIHDFYEKGREQFIADMRRVIGDIGKLIKTGLDDAKAIVADGRKRVETTLDGLGDELADFKREMATQIDQRFADLDGQIAARRRGLVSGLAKRYVAAITKLDEIETEVRNAHKNLLERARDAIIAAKDYVVGQLRRLAEYVGDAAGSIIAHPGQFLTNMAKGIMAGFELFAASIGENIKAAVIEWLTGNLGAAGITLPKTWDAKGIITFLLELVGLGLSNIMAIARKVFGDRVISAIERGVAGFEKIKQIFDILQKDGVAGLWEYLQAEFVAYKEKLLGDAGQALAEGLVVAGVKKAVGLLSGLATGGLGTLLTIVSMIIDTVRWVINNGPRLIELIKTITSMIQDVMSGRVDAIAKAIDKLLKRLLPVVLGFVGALVGIDPVIAKIQKIFAKIREPATKLITKLFTTIRDGLKQLIDKIMRTGAQAAGAVVAWWKKKFGFEVRGAKHSVFIEKANGPIMLASDKHPVAEWLELDNGGKQTARDQPAVFAEIKAAYGAAETARAEIAKAPDAQKPAKQKQFDAAIARLGAALAKANSLGNPVLPPSRITVAPKSIVTAKGTCRVGGLMHAKPLTMLPDPARPDYVGSGPDDKSLWWREINLHRPNTYVQGHLLNDHIHGPGIDQNLAPITRSFNNPMMLNAIETDVKNAIKAGKVIEYRVEVCYANGQKAADHPNACVVELSLPSVWTMEAWELGCEGGTNAADFDKPTAWTRRVKPLGQHYSSKKDPYATIDAPNGDTRPGLNAGAELLREAGGLDHNCHRELPNVRIAFGLFVDLADLEQKFSKYGAQVRAERKTRGLATDPTQIWGELWQQVALAAIKARINQSPKGIRA
jgi:hypothetical protein